MKSILQLFLVLAFVFSSCTKEKFPKSEEDIIGSWVNNSDNSNQLRLTF